MKAVSNRTASADTGRLPLEPGIASLGGVMAVLLFTALIAGKAWAARALMLQTRNPFDALWLEAGLFLLLFSLIGLLTGRWRLWADRKSVV